MKNAPKPTRAGVLHAVTEEILARKDGQIPTNIDGIDTFFHGTEGLADALLLRWHTLLTASLERGLVGDPKDRVEMVIEAGLASGFDEPAIRIGHRLELEARRRDKLVEHTAVSQPRARTVLSKIKTILSG